MKRIDLKLPEGYIPVFRRTIEELKNTSSKIIYLYSPPGYGKTTTLLKFFKETGYHPIFVQLEDRDKDIDIFKYSFLDLLSEFSGRLREVIALTNGKIIGESFFNIIEEECKSIVFPENSYFVFLDTYYLMENFGKVIKGIITPLFKEGGKLDAKAIIESNLPFEFENNVKIMGTEFFTLNEEEIIKVGGLFEEKIDRETAAFLKEKTEGWLLPIILFFKDKRNIETKLNMLKEWPELLQDLLEEIFKELNDEEKINLLALGQLREFSYGAIKWILGYDFPERMIKNIKEKGFVIIEEIKKGILNFRFHRLLKSWLEKKMRKLPMGMEISLRIHAGAMEYFESVQDFENALYHAIKLGDYVRAGKYFKAIVIDLFNQGRISELDTFFKALGLENIPKSYELELCYGIYLGLIEKYKESIKYLERVKDYLEIEDRLLAEYYILLSREALGENEDTLIEESQKLLKKIKEYEEKPPEMIDFEKDPWKIVKRKVIKSPEYFVSLMYARIYNLLGNLYNSKREMEKARKFYEESISFLKKIGDDRRMLTVLHNIGNIELFYGNRSAMEYYQDVISYPVIFPAKANSLNNMGVCYEIYEGDLNKAEHYYKEAYEVNRMFSQRQRIITNVANLLYIYMKKREEEKIKEYLEKLENLMKEAKNPRLINSLYMGKTEILLELDRIEEAKEVFKQINEIEVLKEEPSKYYKIYVEGKLKYAVGEIEEGKRLIERALDWTLEHSSFTDKIEKLYFIYKLYKKYGDRDVDKIREIAERLIKEKGHLKRLRDFDIRT